MNQFLNPRSALRCAAAIAFSIFSYAAMAQTAPSLDACGHVLSSFHKRLYAHFLAGPAALRQFVFSVRGVHLLDIREVDQWARDIQAQVCPHGEAVAAMADEVAVEPSAMPVADTDAQGDGCTTNVLDVMHCPARSLRTREGVIAELRNAQAAGELARVGELSDAPVGIALPATASAGRTRADVRRETALARASHQLAFGER